MKPMLAATMKDVSEIKFPVYGSPKLDGVRGLVIDGELRSRSLKLIPNIYVQFLFGLDELNGLDGELILGSPTAPDVYRQTNGAVSRHIDTPDIMFYVFDFVVSGIPFKKRMAMLDQFSRADNVIILEQTLLVDAAALDRFEVKCLNQGYEGVILRDPDGLYKYGRSTINEGGMVKVKRFTDGEFLLLDIEEEMHNGNEATTNELGRTARSSAKKGLTGKGRAGTLVVEDLVSRVGFRIGTGLDDADKVWFWTHKKKLIKDGFIGKYKSFPVGVKDKPRHPVYLGPREKWDL